MKKIAYDIFYKELESVAQENKIPLNGTFELTPRCNLSCQMCYIKRSSTDPSIKEQELTAEQWIDIARQARDEGMLYALLTGGEVFLRPDFKEIYEGFVNLGLIITIFTNGTLITEEVAKWLAKMPPRKISITLYGASDVTYKKVTGDSKGYEKALKAIELLQNHNLNIELKTTITKDAQEDILKVYDFAYEKDIPFGIVNYVTPARDDSEGKPIKFRLSPNELVKLEKIIKTYIENKEGALVENCLDSSNMETSKMDELNPNIIVSNKFKSNNYQDPFRCNVGKSAFWVNWDGFITGCSDMKEPRVNVVGVKFKEQWSKLVELISMIPISIDCKNCELYQKCLSCPARLYSENKSFEMKADYLCEHTRLSNE